MYPKSIAGTCNGPSPHSWFSACTPPAGRRVPSTKNRIAGACQGTAWAGLCLIHHHHQTGKGAVVLDRQLARPLCLVSCRAPATCRRRHVTETEPTTPGASHPVRTLHQTAPGDRRTSSFVCGIAKCHVGDRDRLFGSSFRPARAIASAIRELRFGTREHFPHEHRSARERRPLKAPGAHSSQRAGSTISLPPSTRPPKPLRSQFRNL